ncbi:MAG TPA: hypothetical protein VFW24_11645 [Acidimicrobiales bacterium]|nr:hypothetical protein [Acidimicrobiales bacterium]
MTALRHAVEPGPGGGRRRRAKRIGPALAAAAAAAGIAGATGALLIGPAATTAWAQAPVQAGWWTQANPGSVEGSPAAPAPPDVPAGGLLVEGGPASTTGASDAGATAFGAVVYPVAAGQSPGTLTLTVAPGSGTTPAATLEVCLLSGAGINAEQGGPMSDAPSFSCSANVTAQPSAAGDEYSFDVSKLVRAGTLALAVLPTTPTDRVVLAKPAAASLSVRPAGAPASGPAPAATGSGSGAAAAPGGAAGDPNTGTPASGDPSSALPALVDPAATLTPAPAGALPAASAPQVPAVPQAGSAQPAAASGSTGVAPVPAAPADTGGARPAAVAGLVLAFLIGAAIWLGAGRAAARAAARGAG